MLSGSLEELCGDQDNKWVNALLKRLFYFLNIFVSQHFRATLLKKNYIYLLKSIDYLNKM